jgi:polyhydroxyalkanoate synthesis regulator phasin
MESIRRTLLGSLGDSPLGLDRVRRVLDDLIRRGELTQEQGRKLIETLLERGRAEKRSLTEKVVREALRLAEKTPFATRRELWKLQRRVRALETRLGMGPEVESEEGTESGAKDEGGSERGAGGADSSGLSAAGGGTSGPEEAHGDPAASGSGAPDEVEPSGELPLAETPSP